MRPGENELAGALQLALDVIEDRVVQVDPRDVAARVILDAWLAAQPTSLPASSSADTSLFAEARPGEPVDN